MKVVVPEVAETSGIATAGPAVANLLLCPTNLSHNNNYGGVLLQRVQSA